MKSKEALEILEKSIWETTGTTIEQEECIYEIKKDLEDFEWLKSKLNIAFIDTLSSPEDKERVLKIMGVRISY